MFYLGIIFMEATASCRDWVHFLASNQVAHSQPPVTQVIKHSFRHRASTPNMKIFKKLLYFYSTRVNLQTNNIVFPLLCMYFIYRRKQQNCLKGLTIIAALLAWNWVYRPCWLWRRPTCLCLPSTGFKGVCHHMQLVVWFLIILSTFDFSGQSSSV